MNTRWDPFREMMMMRRAMDRSANERSEPVQADWALALDVMEKEDQYLVKASLPGVKPADVVITFDKSVLTVRGEVKEETDQEQGQYHLRERRYGVFTRSITLPNTVDADSIKADFSDGVLTLALPKSEEMKPRHIAINSSKN